MLSPTARFWELAGLVHADDLLDVGVLVGGGVLGQEIVEVGDALGDVGLGALLRRRGGSLLLKGVCWVGGDIFDDVMSGWGGKSWQYLASATPIMSNSVQIQPILLNLRVGLNSVG